MVQAAAPCDYDSLTAMQKLEIFELSLKHTAAQDLYKVGGGGGSYACVVLVPPMASIPMVHERRAGCDEHLALVSSGGYEGSRRWKWALAVSLFRNLELFSSLCRHPP